MSEKHVPFVSVVISHVNSSRTIGNCLLHLESVDYPRDRFEVIVVDAGSKDGSLDIVRQVSSTNFRQIIEEGCSEAQGQSVGVQNARGEIIMFTNSDIYVPSDWMRRHVDWLRKGYDMVGGAVFWGGDKFSLTWNLPVPKSPYYKIQPGLGLGFSNCSMRKDFLQRMGGLRNLKSQHDAEFALRSIRNGGKVVLDPEIEVYHDHPFKSFLNNFRRSLGYALNHVLVVRAMFGRIVAGSGMPVFISARSVLMEITLIANIRILKEVHSRAKKWKMPLHVNPLEFILIRIFSSKFGQLIGILVGAFKPRVTMSSVKELHTSVKQAS